MNTFRRIPRRMVKAVSAGAVVIAAVLPLAAATAASAAATSITSVTSITVNAPGTTSGTSFGVGASGVFLLAGTFVNDGGNVTLTTSAAGVTFSGISETATTLSADFASTSATLPGSYSLTVTDNGGTSTLSGAYTVNPAPALASTPLSPTSITDGVPAPQAETITGSGFVGTPAVSFTSTVDGTPMTVGAVTDTGGTSLTFTLNPVNTHAPHAASTAGTYTFTVTNPDGGTATSGAVLTVNAFGATSITPASLPLTGVTHVTITGVGFVAGAVTAYTCAGVSGTLSASSSTTISGTLTTAGATAADCAMTITNPGANGSTGPADIGVGTFSSTLSPAITAVTSPAAPLTVGGSSESFSVTGVGFDPNNGVSAAFYEGTGVTANANVTASCTSDPTGTLLSCIASAATGSIAGPDNIVVTNKGTGGTGSNAFVNAVTVAGPTITASSPAAIAKGAPIGTVIALTGTGLTNTATVAVGGATGLDGTLSATSATTANFVITTSPNATGTATLTVSEIQTNGASVTGTAFDLTVDAAPTLASPYITYPTVNGVATSGVGVGATSQLVTFYGTNFAAGVTIGSFVNTLGAADANVTAKVVSVNATGTQITADIAVAAGDANTSVGYTVTNTDGGTASTGAFSFGAMVIQAAPTITSVSPATATPSSTNALTITGTGFLAGVTVTPSSDGTCGTATLVSSTSITVSCTFGAEGATAVTLVVANANGGSATSATVLPVATPVVKPKPKPFHITRVIGAAVTGKTVTLTIIGTGFFGQPRITSNGAGTRAVVSRDTGTRLTVRVTVKAGTHKGTHTFTVWLANGKSGRVNYTQR